MDSIFKETPDTVHGRLMESVETSGYTMGRSCKSLEWLLEDDRWKQVGNGFDDINEFLKTVDLSRFKIAVEQRKQLSEKLEKLQASQRATARALGVSNETVRNDLGVKKLTTENNKSLQGKELKNGPVNNLTPPVNDGWKDFETVEKIKQDKEKKEQRTQEIKKSREELAEKGASVPVSDRWNVYHGDISTWKTDKQYDFIITDPPYPKEFLPLWSVLSERANEWLKDGGLLIAMSGQSYLDEIYRMLSEHLEYYWTASYLTPGQPTPLRHINVNTTWKPLLIYRKGEYKGKIFGDVFKSDGNDKDNHKWGQSESGMIDIVSKICLSGQSILDPFCGAGTTGIAALKHGCYFDGLEIELENVNISKARLQ